MQKLSSAKIRQDDNCEAESDYLRGKDLDRCEKSLVPPEIPEQPSPVSVLDPSLYKEDCSPPPIVKRSITFTGNIMKLLIILLIMLSSNKQHLIKVHYVLEFPVYMARKNSAFMLQ
jgi:hypothetical protein